MKSLIEISKYAGMREDIVQAGGGNSSVKHADGTITVKASGCQLAEVTNASGYARMNMSAIQAFLAECLDEAACLQAEKRLLFENHIDGGRPSIEAFLHIIAPERVTLHTHPVAVNFFSCTVDWDQRLSALFPDALMIPYVTPGILLARAYVYQAQTHPGCNSCIAFLALPTLWWTDLTETILACPSFSLLRTGLCPSKPRSRSRIPGRQSTELTDLSPRQKHWCGAHRSS